MNGIGSGDATMKVDELISGICGLGQMVCNDRFLTSFSGYDKGGK